MWLHKKASSTGAFLLIYFHDLALEAAGDLGRRERFDVVRLQARDTLRRLDDKRYLHLLAAEDISIGEHVLLLGIDMSVAALVDGVIVDVGVRFLEPELLDLLIAHIDEVEYLQLVRV